MATADEVARYIIGFFQEAGDPVTNLKLQKLLYYVQGWSLALRDEPAFRDRLEAWVHGPVQPGVYGQYKCNRWSPIVEEVDAPNLDANLVRLIGDVLHVYGGDSGYELEMRSHRELPWLHARGDLAPDEESTERISHASMSAFFKTLVEDDDDENQ